MLTAGASNQSIKWKEHPVGWFWTHNRTRPVFLLIHSNADGWQVFVLFFMVVSTLHCATTRSWTAAGTGANPDSKPPTAETYLVCVGRASTWRLWRPKHIVGLPERDVGRDFIWAGTSSYLYFANYRIRWSGKRSSLRSTPFAILQRISHASGSILISQFRRIFRQVSRLHAERAFLSVI